MMVYRRTLNVLVPFLLVSPSNANGINIGSNNKDHRRFLDQDEHDHHDDHDYDSDFTENGSFQFEKCTSSTLSQNNQNGSPMSYWITFSSNIEGAQCGDQSDHPEVVKQTHVIDIRSYLEIMAGYLTNLQELECNACDIYCVNNPRYPQRFLEDSAEFIADSDAFCGTCVEECGYIENMEENGYLEATIFLSCQMIYDPEDNPGGALYAGPYCGEDGQSIRIGVFVDEECTIRDSKQFAEDYILDNNGYPMKLSYALLKSLYKDDSSCRQCNARSDNHIYFWMSQLDDEEVEYVLDDTMNMCYALMKESQNVDHDEDVVLQYSDAIQLKKCNAESIPTTSVAASRSTNIVPIKQFATVDVKSNCNDEEDEEKSKETLLMDLDTYLEHVVQYREIEQTRKCNQCEQICDDFLDEDDFFGQEQHEENHHDTYNSCVLCRDQCYSTTDNEVYKASQFIRCSSIKNLQQGIELYAGPVCSEGGHAIKIGVFLDKECTMFDPTKNVEDYLTTTGNRLDYGLLESATFADDSCISCQGRSQDAHDFDYPFDFWVTMLRENQEMCANLFEADANFEFETELLPSSLPPTELTPTAAPTSSSSVVVLMTPLLLLLSVMVVVSSFPWMSS